MPLQKQPLQINFSKGLDLKTDPLQVSPGSMLVLQNTVFDKGGLLQKRNGFSPLPILTDTSVTTLSTYANNLIAVGNQLNVLSLDNSQWINKGYIQAAELSVLSLVRTAGSQSTVDAATSSNGLVITVYLDADGNNYYQILDSNTGQIIISRTQLPATATLGRVFTLGQYFIVTFLETVSAATHLRYIAIPFANPSAPTAPKDIITQVTNLSAGYDGYSVNNSLYLAVNSTDGGGAIRMTSIDFTLLQHGVIVIAGQSGALMSITADVSGSTPVIWLSWWNSSSTNAFAAAYNQQLTQLLAPTQILTSVSMIALTSTANVGSLLAFYETDNDYAFSGVRSDYTSKITCTSTGTVGTPAIVDRSVGIASKAFYLSTTNLSYFLAVYGGAFEPTYFLLDQNDNVIAKLAYSNASGYVINQILSGVSLSGTTVQIGYLFKDQITAVNKSQGAPAVAGIYAQTGINLATIDITTPTYITSEIGNNLHLTGGYLWMYDGAKPVEHNFHLWPEDLLVSPIATGGGMEAQLYYYYATYEWTDATGNIHRSAPSVPFPVTVPPGTPITFTSSFSAGVSSITVSSAAGLVFGQQIVDITDATPITFTSIFDANVTFINVSSTSGLVIGQTITDTTSPGNIQAGTTIVDIDSVNMILELSLPTAGASASSPGDTLSTDTPETLAPDTYITSISGTTVGLNQPTIGAATSNTFQTTQTGSATVYVPTLRLTAKTLPNLVRICIYRWSAAQQEPYLITPVTSPILNDKTVDYITFIDTQADEAIIGNQLLYTFGGTVEDIAAPACTVSTLFKTRLFVVDAEDQNLMWFSKQTIEDTPVEMSDLFTMYIAPTVSAQGNTGPILALSALDDKLIIFKKNAIYYVTGDGPDNTGANNDFSEPIFITATVGCSNPESIVFTPQGLMFQSDKGIWILGRDLSTNYIGAPVEEFNTDIVVSAINIPGTNQVRFTLNSGITLMYDYYFSQWGTFVNVPAISSTLYQGLHTYVNASDAVFQESPGQYMDASNPVLMSFTTGWFNLAGLQGFQRAYFFYLLGTYISPHKLNVTISYDYNQLPSQSVLIPPDNFNLAYGGDSPYGAGTPYGDNPTLEQWRVFFTQGKCESFQIAISEIPDTSFPNSPGAGLSISGLTMIVGVKKGYNALKPSRSAS